MKWTADLQQGQTTLNADTESGMFHPKSIQFKVVLWAGGGFLLGQALLVTFAALAAPSGASEITPKLIGTAIVLSIGACVGLWFWAGQIADPLKRMTQAARALVFGNYLPVDATRTDEIGQLADAFRALATKAQADHASEQMVTTERNILRGLVENLPDLIYVKDTQSRFLVANPTVVRLLGGKVEADLLGKSDLDFFPRDLAIKYMTDEQTITQSGQPLLDCVEPTVDPQGNKQWLSTSKIPFRDNGGKVVGLVGIGRDISKQKQSEEKLSVEHNLLQALMDSSPDSIAFKDAESRYLRISKAKALKHGLKDPLEAVGKSDLDYFGEEHYRAGRASEQEIMRTGKAIINVEEKQRLADGSEAWFLTSKMPLCNTEEQIVGTYSVSRNITKQKQAEEGVAKERDALKEVVKHLQESAVKVMASSAKILASSTQMASTTREQASAVNQVTSTVKEIKASAEQVAQRA